MKIPASALIDRNKLTDYLLIPKPKNDKSKYLAQVGFTQENPHALEAAIRRLIAESEAIADREDAYGVFYRVAGNLYGPRGILPVITIWIRQHGDGTYRFITMKPAR